MGASTPMIAVGRSRLLALDAGFCLALAGATIFYLWLWPRSLYLFDEGLFLYESRRLLEGAVFYRDMLEIITPGAFYYMALVFRVFGVSLDNAKMAMAVVHAATTVLVFLCCRRAGVRRSFSFAAAVAHPAIAFAGMVSTSPHWFGTMLTLLVLYLLLALRWRQPGRALVLVGLANGALVMVQQQKGVVIAAGVCAVLIADNALAHRALAVRALTVRLGFFVAGILLLAGPATLALLWAAGFGPMWESLIVFPLTHYPGFAQCRRWGFAGAESKYAIPGFVAALPAIAGLLPLRLVIAWLAGEGDGAARPWVVVYFFLATSAVSVYYCPNYGHLSLIAPVGCIALAQAIDWPVTALARWTRAVSVVAALGAMAVVGGLLQNARANLERRVATYRFAYPSEVGVVQVRNSAEITLLDAIIRRTDPGDALFAYPTIPGIYFLTGTVNPTRFQIMLPGYHDETHFREAADVVERSRVPYVVIQARPREEADPVLDLAKRAYRQVWLSFPPGQFSNFALLERRDEPVGLD